MLTSSSYPLGFAIGLPKDLCQIYGNNVTVFQILKSSPNMSGVKVFSWNSYEIEEVVVNQSMGYWLKLNFLILILLLLSNFTESNFV